MPGNRDLVHFVESYRNGQFREVAAERVNSWLNVFPQDSRDRIASELAHVLGNSFITHEDTVAAIRRWIGRPQQLSGGLVNNWADASFLSVQTGGGSQHALLSIWDTEVGAAGGTTTQNCRGQSLFVYVDDVSIHGMRILNDLTPWIRFSAPRTSNLLLLLQMRLKSQEDYLTSELKGRARASGKTLTVRWSCDHDFTLFDCYQPTRIPSDPELERYMSDAELKIRLRDREGTGQFFSSTISRQLLEDAMLFADIRVLQTNPHLRNHKHMRPLGNTVWRGFGPGVPIVTWRNCPNSAPLCLWAEGDGPALFPRKVNEK